jgi:phage terminase Nu1 subunit (DNA packaging protein)
MNLANIFKSVPEKLDKKFIEVLAQKGDVKIERIISKVIHRRIWMLRSKLNISA